MNSKKNQLQNQRNKTIEVNTSNSSKSKVVKKRKLNDDNNDDDQYRTINLSTNNVDIAQRHSKIVVMKNDQDESKNDYDDYDKSDEMNPDDRSDDQMDNQMDDDEDESANMNEHLAENNEDSIKRGSNGQQRKNKRKPQQLSSEEKPMSKEEYLKLFMGSCNVSSSSKGFNENRSNTLRSEMGFGSGNIDAACLGLGGNKFQPSRYKDCYAAYAEIKKNYANYVKEMKRIQKENAPIYEKIKDSLSNAIKFQKSSDKFRESGKDKQAENMHKKSVENVKDAKIMYDNMADEDDKDELLDAYHIFLKDPTLDGLYKLERDLSDVISSSSKKTNQQNIEPEQGKTKEDNSHDANDEVVSTEKLNDHPQPQPEELKKLKTKVKICKQYIEEITKTIDAALPYIENEDYKNRLEQLLELKQEI